MAVPEAQPLVAATEEVDGIVVRDARLLPATRPAGQVAVAQAAVAATSFAVGAAAAVVIARHRGRKSARRLQRGRRRGRDIAATHSFLVDVHVLNR